MTRDAAGAPRPWGLLTYETENVGDDIQSVAARRFLPRVELVVDRERLASAPPARLVLNGWYCHDGERCWPPADAVTPLLISMHVAAHARPRFAAARSVAYLRRHAPVGARDASTLRFLREIGVPAYLSRCLTLSLPPFAGRREPVIVLVDVPDEVVLPGGLPARIVRVTHVLPHRFRADAVARLRRAERLLALYRVARLAVTTRLHCALPCAAFGTPAILLRRDSRISGMEEAVTLWDLADAKAGKWPFDLGRPPPASDLSEWAAESADRCREFVGRSG